MARISKTQCKLCRRAGEKLFLKGDRCGTPKCAIVRKPYGPGMHGPKGSRGLSEFGKQLAEKQKLKRIYGVSERQLRQHLAEAKKSKGVLGDNLAVRLEARLDNIIYRLGLASSRTQARQMVTHGHFLVNGKSLNIPSTKIKIGDEIALKETKQKKSFYTQLATILKKKVETAAWLSFDPKTMKGKVKALPKREEAVTGVDLPSVIEFYSR